MPGIDLLCGQVAVNVSFVFSTETWEARGMGGHRGQDVTGRGTELLVPRPGLFIPLPRTPDPQEHAITGLHCDT